MSSQQQLNPGRYYGSAISAQWTQRKEGSQSVGIVFKFNVYHVMSDDGQWAALPEPVEVEGVLYIIGKLGAPLGGVPKEHRSDSLSAAFRKHPLYFDALYCNLVEAGEAGGILEALLDRLDAARRFGQACETVRYTASAIVDLAVHERAEPIDEVLEVPVVQVGGGQHHGSASPFGHRQSGGDGRRRRDGEAAEPRRLGDGAVGRL